MRGRWATGGGGGGGGDDGHLSTDAPTRESDRVVWEGKLKTTTESVAKMWHWEMVDAWNKYLERKRNATTTTTVTGTTSLAPLC
ncbi:unnamed protein product [Hydatigera taeniaeformis]|uniref:Uncharacterized protein n=1 Tax=Hydatigena taeniaeformis TaxID=6205 RepID=A0A0R3WXW3_HYDTA|nr:unnamed protein product [Hydatigera taeniaeformis]